MPKKDKDEGHYDDLTDAGRAADPEPDVDAFEGKPSPPADPEPERRIEDLLKDKTFDRAGRVRSRLARLSVQGVEYAPPDLVALGR